MEEHLQGKGERENNSSQEEKRIYSFDELPIVINVPELTDALGISKTAAYALSHIKGFPVIHLGKRIVIPRERLKEWLENSVGADSDWGLTPYYSNQTKSLLERYSGAITHDGTAFLIHP